MYINIYLYKWWLRGAREPVEKGRKEDEGSENNEYLVGLTQDWLRLLGEGVRGMDGGWMGDEWLHGWTDR